MDQPKLLKIFYSFLQQLPFDFCVEWLFTCEGLIKQHSHAPQIETGVVCPVASLLKLASLIKSTQLGHFIIQHNMFWFQLLVTQPMIVEVFHSDGQLPHHDEYVVFW